LDPGRHLIQLGLALLEGLAIQLGQFLQASRLYLKYQKNRFLP
jgi:hypothetical protein